MIVHPGSTVKRCRVRWAAAPPPGACDPRTVETTAGSIAGSRTCGGRRRGFCFADLRRLMRKASGLVFETHQAIGYHANVGGGQRVRHRRRLPRHGGRAGGSAGQRRADQRRRREAPRRRHRVHDRAVQPQGGRHVSDGSREGLHHRHLFQARGARAAQRSRCRATARQRSLSLDLAHATNPLAPAQSNLVSSIHKLRDEMLAGIREGAAEGDEATARAFAKGSAARDSLAGMQADCEDDEEKARAAMVANASGE